MIKTKSLYNEYRPITFDSIVGQKHVTAVLKQQLADNSVSHAYLLTGTRGTGKTSTGRVLARAVNCLAPVDGNPCNECTICRLFSNEHSNDFIELDAASNNGVSDMEKVIQATKLCNTDADFKVVLIDEAHMLSTAAFNSFLKELEQPLPNVIYILATTEDHKIPDTIASRCQRLEFKTILLEDIIERLRYIVDDQEMKIDEDALVAIAQSGNGSLRDSIRNLQSCMIEHINLEYVEMILDMLNEKTSLLMCDALLEGDASRVINLFDDISSKTTNMKVVISSLIRMMRDILIAQFPKADKRSIKNRTEEIIQSINSVGQKHASKTVLEIVDKLCKLQGDISHDSHPVIRVEASLISISVSPRSDDYDELETKVSFLLDEVNKLKDRLHATSNQKNENVVNHSSSNQSNDPFWQAHTDYIEDEPPHTEVPLDQSLHRENNHSEINEESSGTNSSTEEVDREDSELDISSLRKSFREHSGKTKDNAVGEDVKKSTRKKTIQLKQNELQVKVINLFEDDLVKALLECCIFKTKNRKLHIESPLNSVTLLLKDRRDLVNYKIKNNYKSLNIVSHEIVLLDI